MALSIRKAREDDAEFLFRLRTDPDSQRMFFGAPPADLAAHTAWLQKQLREPDFFLYILEQAGTPVAYFRVAGGGDVSVAVRRESRGQGVAARAIRLGTAEHLAHMGRDFTYVALIRKDNPASRAAFSRAGYQPMGEESREGESVDRLEFRPGRHAVCCAKVWRPDLAGELTRRTGALFTLITEKEALTPQALREIKAEFVFFPHWSHLVPKEVYEQWPCVMFHMTDLPYGRGGSPLQNLIVRKHRETKISCFRCDGGLDTGPIYLKRPLTLQGSAREIYARATAEIAEMIVEFLEKRPEPKLQKGEPVMFKRRKPEEGDLAALHSAEEIYDFIRMLDADGYPPAFLKQGELVYEFSDAELREGAVEAKVRIRKA